METSFFQAKQRLICFVVGYQHIYDTLQLKNKHKKGTCTKYYTQPQEKKVKHLTLEKQCVGQELLIFIIGLK